MVDGSTAHEVLAVVLQVRDGCLSVLLWRRAQEPDAGRWALPGGRLGADEAVESSVRRQLAEKVDVRQVAHLEQLAVFSDPRRRPGPRVVASAFLGLIPAPTDPRLPADTAWHAVGTLPPTAFDHRPIIERAESRLRHKLSYTNIAFALAPPTFTMSTLRGLYATVLGHPVDATNLLRILRRRGVVDATGTAATSGPSGGRPAALYRFTDSALRVTDAFAALRPPG